MSYKISKQHQINRPAISVKSKYDNNYSFANEQEEPPAEYNFTDSPEFEEDQDISEDDQEFEEDDSPSPEHREEHPVYFLAGYPPPEPQQLQENSPSPAVYMKRIRRLSFLANMFCHIALWIFILSLIFFPYMLLMHADFFPTNESLGLPWLLCSVIIPLSLGFANMITANFVMANIRNYCYLVYPYDENRRIQEIQQLTLEYIGLVSSHFLLSLFSRR